MAERQSLLGKNTRDQQDNSSQLKKKIYNARYFRCFFIGQWPVLHVIWMTLLANFFVNFPTEATKDSHKTVQYKITLMSKAIRGIVLLLYPLMGWLAEAYITYYKSIGGGLYLILTSMTIAFGLSITALFDNSIMTEVWYWVLAGTALAMSFLGNGLFSANAIQLGTDQMIEASSEQLSSFVHWYYWATQLGGSVGYCMIIVIGFACGWHGYQMTVYFLATVLCLSQVILTIMAITIFHSAKVKLSIQPTRKNTISTIFSVLRYAKKHKYPQRRSAMTYWEDRLPSRIDLGKEKYGGPFAAEEVENTKSFLRILVLLISLFGIYTVDDTSSLTEYIVHGSNSSNTSLHLYPSIQMFIIHNTEFINQLTLLLLVPLYQLAIKPLLNNYVPSMVKRFWMGLLCALLSSVTALVIKIIASTDEHDNTKCRSSLFVNQYGINTLLALLAIPQVLRGLAELLVFLTGLEFILAQAPRKVQGLLIGLWYAIGIIKQGNDYTDDFYKNDKCIVYITRCCLTLISLIVYSIVLYFYKYRNRDDIVDRYNLAANKVANTISRREQEKGSLQENSFRVSVLSNRTSINSEGERTTYIFNEQ